MLDPYVLELFMENSSPNVEEVTQVAEVVLQHNLQITNLLNRDHLTKKRKCNKPLTHPLLPINRLKAENKLKLNVNFIRSCNEREYIKRFSMTKFCMEDLISYVSSRLKDKLNDKCRVISLDKKMHIFVHLMTTTESFRKCAIKFGLNNSTVSYIFRDISKVLAGLKEDLIQWPNFEEQKVIKREVYNRHKFPNCVGFIDCYSIYKLRQNKFTVALQGVCDHNLIFQDVWLGHSSEFYKNIFKRSSLYQNLKDLVLEQDHLLGSAHYPLQLRLMTPYEDKQTKSIEVYNKVHEEAHSYIKKAFERLKLQFKRLTALQIATNHTFNAVYAAIVLHNFKITHELKIRGDSQMVKDENTLHFGKGLQASDKRKLICDTLSFQDV
ncbi:uncharacterized protein [Euwallacea similis]|uniref:uncharacterized protein n=1 Tax=Euwallacea similis TaxID=1736056 RepID=UPI00344BD941